MREESRERAFWRPRLQQKEVRLVSLRFKEMSHVYREGGGREKERERETDTDTDTDTDIDTRASYA